MNRICVCLKPTKSLVGKGKFPTGLIGSIPCFHSNQHYWLNNVVNALGGDLESIKLTENVGVVAQVSWKDNYILSDASIHAIITPCNNTLDDLYLEPSTNAHYLRLDISTETKGNPFTHSCAHVHIVENGPRFDMALGDDGNIVADFIEFIFIHYIYNEWWEWVKDTCERFTQGNFISDFPLERIEDAFKEGKTDIMLRELEQYIVQMKSELNKRKCNMCELRLSKPVQGIMKYPI